MRRRIAQSTDRGVDELMSCSEQVRVECWPLQSVRWSLQCASVCDIRQILPTVSPCPHGPSCRSQIERAQNSFTRGRSFVDRFLPVLPRDPTRYLVRLASIADQGMTGFSSHVGSVGGMNMLVAPLCRRMRFAMGSTERRGYAPLHSSVAEEDFVSR